MSARSRRTVATTSMNSNVSRVRVMRPAPLSVGASELIAAAAQLLSQAVAERDIERRAARAHEPARLVVDRHRANPHVDDRAVAFDPLALDLAVAGQKVQALRPRPLLALFPPRAARPRPQAHLGLLAAGAPPIVPRLPPCG